MYENTEFKEFYYLLVLFLIAMLQNSDDYEILYALHLFALFNHHRVLLMRNLTKAAIL